MHYEFIHHLTLTAFLCISQYILNTFTCRRHSYISTRKLKQICVPVGLAETPAEMQNNFSKSVLIAQEAEQAKAFAISWIRPFAVHFRVNALAYIVQSARKCICHQDLYCSLLKLLRKLRKFYKKTSRQQLEENEIIRHPVTTRRSPRQYRDRVLSKFRGFVCAKQLQVHNYDSYSIHWQRLQAWACETQLRVCSEEFVGDDCCIPSL